MLGSFIICLLSFLFYNLILQIPLLVDNGCENLPISSSSAHSPTYPCLLPCTSSTTHPLRLCAHEYPHTGQHTPTHKGDWPNQLKPQSLEPLVPQPYHGDDQPHHDHAQATVENNIPIASTLKVR